MATKLGLYNKALGHLGQRKLASLTEDQEARLYLDDEYVCALEYCLRQGLWNFAIRTIKMDFEVKPAFGYTNGFLKPSDWVKTATVSLSEFGIPPLWDYQDQGSHWLANSTLLYVRYVSKALGMVEGSFPSDYAEYVGGYLAKLIMPRITQKGQEEVKEFSASVMKMMKIAKANDALDQPPGIIATGSWVNSRGGGGGGTRGTSRFLPGLG